MSLDFGTLISSQQEATSFFIVHFRTLIGIRIALSSTIEKAVMHMG